MTHWHFFLTLNISWEFLHSVSIFLRHNSTNCDFSLSTCRSLMKLFYFIGNFYTYATGNCVVLYGTMVCKRLCLSISDVFPHIWTLLVKFCACLYISGQVIYYFSLIPHFPLYCSFYTKFSSYNS